MAYYRTLISAQQLTGLLAETSADVLVADCRFDLKDTAVGEQRYAESHIPGAIYLHLDRDLAGEKTGSNGRHPLPELAGFAERLASLGVNKATQIVAYDASGGMYAARLWWMARWAGHDAVAVLDGGLEAWSAAGLPGSSEIPAKRPRGDFGAVAATLPTLSFVDVQRNLGTGERIVIDARSPDRFRGENETIDPVGGHIPGARNRFYQDNLGTDGRFKPADALRAEFQKVLGGADPQAVVAQCGSGVTACHNLLALEIAGLAGAALYPGSWSEWSARASPDEIATGAAGT